MVNTALLHLCWSACQHHEHNSKSKMCLQHGRNYAGLRVCITDAIVLVSTIVLNVFVLGVTDKMNCSCLIAKFVLVRVSGLWTHLCWSACPHHRCICALLFTVDKFYSTIFSRDFLFFYFSHITISLKNLCYICSNCDNLIKNLVHPQFE